MKLFRVVSKVDDGHWCGTLVLAETEVDAANDPCLPLNRKTKTQDSESCYTATELTLARVADVEEAHHCPRYIWAFDDSHPASRAFADLQRKLRYELRPVGDLILPRIVRAVSARPKPKSANSSEHPESIAS